MICLFCKSSIACLCASELMSLALLQDGFKDTIWDEAYFIDHVQVFEEKLAEALVEGHPACTRYRGKTQTWHHGADFVCAAVGFLV